MSMGHAGRSRVFAGLLLAGCVLLALVPALFARAGASTSDGVVEFAVFTSPGCHECEFLAGELESLKQKYGDRIKYEYLDVDAFDNFRKMINTESRYGRTDMQLPQIYLGTSALIGPDEVKEDLEPIINQYLGQGGSDMPDTSQAGNVNPEPGKTPVYIAYFYKEGCRRCDVISRQLDYLEDLKKYGVFITTRRYDISKTRNLVVNEAMCQVSGVPENERGIVPAVFVGNDYLEGKDLNLQTLNEAVRKNQQADTPVVPWEAASKALDRAQTEIEQRFGTIGWFTVIGAGLVDGVNPCAFTVIVFLVSYLAFTDRRKREILYVGGAFTVTVFATYLAIGIGLFGLARVIGASGAAGRWLTLVVAALTLVFGIVAVADFARSKKKGKTESTLGLSRGLVRRIHKAIREHTRTRYLVLGAVVLGIIVTALELGCTGQVYLPTITYVARTGADRVRAIGYLIVYDIMFIIPLLVIFLLAYVGTSQEKLVEFGRKHAPTMELLGGVALIGLSALLFATL